jgi:hypothetical protein
LRSINCLQYPPCGVLIHVMSPHYSVQVEIQLERNEYYISKILDNVPDEDDMGLVEGINADIKYTIRVNDDDPL